MREPTREAQKHAEEPTFVVGVEADAATTKSILDSAEDEKLEFSAPHVKPSFYRCSRPRDADAAEHRGPASLAAR